MYQFKAKFPKQLTMKQTEVHGYFMSFLVGYKVLMLIHNYLMNM